MCGADGEGRGGEARADVCRSARWPPYTTAPGRMRLHKKI